MMLVIFNFDIEMLIIYMNHSIRHTALLIFPITPISHI